MREGERRGVRGGGEVILESLGFESREEGGCSERLTEEKPSDISYESELEVVLMLPLLSYCSFKKKEKKRKKEGREERGDRRNEERIAGREGEREREGHIHRVSSLILE